MMIRLTTPVLCILFSAIFSPVFAQAPKKPAAPTTTSFTGSTVTSSALTVQPADTTFIPGYTNGPNYGKARTIAYVAAPFAVVAGTYLAGHRKVEISPVVGYFWPGKVDYFEIQTHLRDEGLYGLRAATAINDHVQIEGSFGYVNHFESRFAPTMLDQSQGVVPETVHGLLYDINVHWNFSERPFFDGRVTPYVTGGIGGLSTQVKGESQSALIGGQLYSMEGSGLTEYRPTNPVIVYDNGAFLNFNYGGGVRVLRLWGPVGFRVDLRARAFPNFRGKAMVWPEAAAGLTFSFGER
jgi:hypothetical protein